jgi:hypothetical protein
MLSDAQPGVFAHWRFDWRFDAELKYHDLHLRAKCPLREVDQLEQWGQGRVRPVH